jgi:hypothetical protein
MYVVAAPAMAKVAALQMMQESAADARRNAGRLSRVERRAERAERRAERRAATAAPATRRHQVAVVLHLAHCASTTPRRLTCTTSTAAPWP